MHFLDDPRYERDEIYEEIVFRDQWLNVLCPGSRQDRKIRISLVKFLIISPEEKLPL